MVFIATSGGIIEASVPSPVAQGSYLSNEIVLLAPFPESAMVTCAFVLPNGIRTAEALTDNTEYAMAAIQIPSITETATGRQYSAWRYTLNGALTEFAGDVTVQFFVYHSTSRLATYAATFYVASGVDVILPDPPDSNIYREILEAITALNLDNSVIVDQMQAEIERIDREKVNRVIPVDQTVVYAADPTGDITIKLSSYPEAYMVAGYGNGGVLKTNTPTDALDATNKQYVDSAVGAVESVASELSEQIDNNTQSITDLSEQIDNNTQSITDLSERIDKNSKRLTNLEKGITPDPFYTDDSIAYVKYVPANALPYAEVLKIGGKTNKVGDELIDSPVTKIDVSGGVLSYSVPIPEAVQAIDGYGWGIDSSMYNYIYWAYMQFVKRVGCVDMGTLDWTKSEFSAEGANVYVKTINDIKSPTTSSERRTGFLCAKYGIATTVTLSGVENMTMFRNTNKRIVVRDDSYADATAFKAAMSGVMLYYELETPIITDISNLLHEDNYIKVEGGGTVTMANEHGYAVPSTITYQLKQEEATA
mgnify:CR=1 FL=1